MTLESLDTVKRSKQLYIFFNWHIFWNCHKHQLSKSFFKIPYKVYYLNYERKYSFVEEQDLAQLQWLEMVTHQAIGTLCQEMPSSTFTILFFLLYYSYLVGCRWQALDKENTSVGGQQLLYKLHRVTSSYVRPYERTWAKPEGAGCRVGWKRRQLYLNNKKYMSIL